MTSSDMLTSHNLYLYSLITILVAVTVFSPSPAFGCQCICQPNIIIKLADKKSLVSVSQERCPANYTMVDEKCYEYVSPSLDRIASKSIAESICKDKGAKVPLLKSTKELDDLAKWIRKLHGLHKQDDDTCNGPADIIFVVDESGSVLESNFEKAKNFIVNVASKFDVGQSESQTRIGVMTYSSSVDIDIHLNDCGGLRHFAGLVKNLRYARGGTDTQRALQMVGQNMILKEKGARSGVSKIVILMTDGRSATDPVQVSQHLKNLGIKIFGVGIGSFDRSQLISIVNQPVKDFMIKVDNYSDLSRIIKRLTNDVCQSTSVRLWVDENSVENNKQNLPKVSVVERDGKCIIADVEKSKVFLKKIKCSNDEGIICLRNLIKSQ